MTQTVYLNGSFLPRDQATLGIEDRGILFSDGAYEVLRYHHGRAFAMSAHVKRFRNSLEGLAFPPSCLDAFFNDLPGISDELVKRNALPNAKVYWQVTRGQAPRNHLLPVDPKPTLLLIAYPAAAMSDDPQPQPVRVTLVDDTRWTQCWIKSLMLLPNSIARSHASARGFDEAIFERAKPLQHAPRHVTEGSSTNLFIVRDGELHTHPADHWILAGITRAAVIDLADEMGIACREKPFDRAALLGADEAFICGTTADLAPITHVDGQELGEAGPITRRLFDAYIQQLPRGV